MEYTILQAESSSLLIRYHAYPPGRSRTHLEKANSNRASLIHFSSSFTNRERSNQFPVYHTCYSNPNPKGSFRKFRTTAQWLIQIQLTVGLSVVQTSYLGTNHVFSDCANVVHSISALQLLGLISVQGKDLRYSQSLV